MSKMGASDLNMTLGKEAHEGGRDKGLPVSEKVPKLCLTLSVNWVQ